MKNIIIDGAEVKKKNELRNQLNMQFGFDDWHGNKLAEYIDKVSGFTQLDYFKTPTESLTQFVLVLKNSDELFEKSPSTFKWLIRRIMKVNRLFKETYSVEEGLIAIKLL